MNDPTLDTRLAATLAGWLARIARRLNDVLERRPDGLAGDERRQFAAALLELRPALGEAATAPSLARAIAGLALLVGQFPPVLARLRSQDESRPEVPGAMMQVNE